MQKKMYVGVLALATLAILMTVSPALAGADTGKFEDSFVYDGKYRVEYRINYVCLIHPDASGKLHFNLKLNVAFKAYCACSGEYLGSGHFNGQINGWIDNCADCNAIIRGNLRIGMLDIKFHIIVKFQNCELKWMKIWPAP